MISRKWNFPISTLVSQATVLHDALIDPAYTPSMAERLDLDGDTAQSNYATRFASQISTVTSGGTTHKGKTGQAGTLTKAQTDALQELERLTNGGRRSARLTFPGDDVKLHSEFQVGIDTPKTLASELERARIILASCQRHTAALKKHGWTAKDTTALDTAITALENTSLDQSNVLDDRAGLTEDRILAGNALYAQCLAIQNAARLEYPSNRPGNEAARHRFLLNEFPPRDRSNPSGDNPPPPPAPVTSTPPKP